MDIELLQARSQLRLSLMCLQARQRRLDGTTAKKSRHFNRVRHTHAMVSLLEELLGVLAQDPDNWDDDPELAPF